ncbi:hypothetical protein I316_07777 [Kwoniella heveanensis BCC8398]|uniref:Uncharacterized protein n=1 Tax=Kwoniella heveanensis BCC8398 TaxID=1296120 RepID=A0A1B9GHT6_9TREE|nr:hypothetical protein I316_07777 [Kwoniella heveanensis BCC8398]
MTSQEGSRSTTHRIPNQSSSTWYLRHLDTHIRASRDHVLGETYGVRYQSSYRDTVVPPSNAIWTPEEKSLFFASLRRHSRFRADVIAGEVGTKTEIEVEWYLDLLESGAAQVGQVDANRKVHGKQRARWDGIRSWREGLAPACREVSAGWVVQEESLAEEVMGVVNTKEAQDHREITRTARRSERRALNKVIPLDANFTSHQRKKYLDEHPSTVAMFNRWAVDDWGESIDAGKMSTLNGLLRPDWCEWYSERVRLPSPVRLADGISETDDDDNQHLMAGPIKGDPHGRIANDLRNFQRLSLIPKSERTPAQRRTLAAIVNRRRNREKYRLTKLIQEGMTKEEIQAAGGADAVFASRDHPEDGNQAAEYRQKTVLGGSKAEIKEEGSVNQLKKWGMYDHLLLSGMEVFNYDIMARLTSQIAASSFSDSPSISFPVLRRIHADLVNYLRSLLYNAIVIAEQAHHQRPADQEDEEDGEMTSDHVYQALILAGEDCPAQVVSERLGRIFEDAGEELDSEAGGVDGQEVDDCQERERTRRGESTPPADGDGNKHAGSASDTGADKPINLRRRGYPASLLSQSDTPWHLIASLPQSNSTAPNVGHADEAAAAESELEEAEAGIDFSALSDATTEQEGNDLDEALEVMDKAHDKLCEKGLKNAAKRKRKRKYVSPTTDGGEEEGEAEEVDAVNDGGDVWTSMIVQRMNGKTVRPRLRVEQDYLDLLFSIDNARSKRQYVQRREARYPTTRLRKKAREHKNIKSTAFIIDSDSDSDIDDYDDMSDVENAYVAAADEVEEDEGDQSGSDDEEMAEEGEEDDEERGDP